MGVEVIGVCLSCSTTRVLGANDMCADCRVARPVGPPNRLVRPALNWLPLLILLTLAVRLVLASTIRLGSCHG